MSSTTCLRRVVSFICGVAVGLFLLTGAASAEPKKDSTDTSSPQPASKADFSGNGANRHGSYDSTRDGSPSGNGNGGGTAKGKPCAGCVGKADNKNPKGQAPDGSDHNAGYECDRNRGIGRTNPAHTGCARSTSTAGDVGGTDDSVGSDDSDSTTKPVADTDVAGVSVTRAASTPGADGAGVLGSGATRGGAADIAVAGILSAAGAGQGSGALPVTGAGAGVMALALVAVALLGAGALLSRVRRQTV